MRTSFDTELELPKLQAWFAENPHPSRQQVCLLHLNCIIYNYIYIYIYIILSVI